MILKYHRRRQHILPIYLRVYICCLRLLCKAPLYCRLQTGMRGAFGKPQGTVARVHIGQPIMSVRCKDNHKAVAIEALRRAKFKFPGRQKVCTAIVYFLVFVNFFDRSVIAVMYNSFSMH